MWRGAIQTVPIARMSFHNCWRRSHREIAFCLVLASVAGCDRGPTLAPVSGKVLLNGQPLEFGSVMFQPSSGQPAIGEIQPDGTFTLSTFAPNDGAVVGVHKVRIACYESQRRDAQKGPGEQSLGKLLIPMKYTLFDQSGLTAEVREDHNEPVVFELVDSSAQSR
jgi:hypothetical protein